MTVSLLLKGAHTDLPSLDLLLGEALDHHREGAYYRKFLRDNKRLGPVVDSYIQGIGPRPSEQLLGANHYARGLVLTEDGRRTHG